MIVENAGFSGGYYQNTFELPCESEESGSSGRVGTELTASEDSSTPSKKCIKLNSDKENPYGVPKEVFSASNMSRSDRVDLVHRLRLELEQTKVFLKKAKLQRTYDPAVSSTSYIVSSSNEQKVFRLDSFRKSSLFAAGPGKKVQPLENNARGCNRSSLGRFESAKPAPASTGNVMLMKQCETLLKRLMSHQYSWVFNIPVDVEKLKIPDYYTVIKHPMDLGTIKNKLNAGEYSSPLEFAADVRLTFSNAMKYNPPKNDVHIMADTLGKFFEVRWKTIEKKLPMLETESLPETSRTHEDKEINKAMPPTKRRKTASPKHRIMEEPVKPVMSKEERHNLGRQLESLLDEIPQHIIDFLKKHSSNGVDTGDDEIEIDIDVLSDDILFTLRKLLDDHSKEKQKKQPITEPCEIVLLNGSGPSSSSMQHGNELADEDVGRNQPPVSGSSSDSDSSSSENESDGAKAISQENTLKVPQDLDSEAQLDKKTTIVSEPLEMSESACGLDHPKNTSQEKPCSVESDNRQEGKSAPLERQVSSEKLYRAALLKNQFADIILKAREKALPQNDMGDPEKLRKEREVLELQKKKEKARLQAEAKAAEDARKQAEAEVAAETKRKIEQEREAARQALLKMERTVEINENSRFLEDLEMLSAAPAEHLPSLEDESKSPERCLEGLGSFKFGGSNPLEQLGLFMKLDDEEDEAESAGAGDPGNNDVEEGEID